jgi:nitrate/TMAO reductase-like tetraheme cytochrome c subunit
MLIKSLMKRQIETETPEEPAASKKINWLKVSLIANIGLVVLIVFGLGGMAIIHQSDTNPNLCALCHPMQANVQSYQTSTNLDNLHMQAGVACKECHDYTIPQEIRSGINYLIGNYEVDTNGELLQREYEDEMCLKCHLDYEYLAQSTDYLVRNPHLHHSDELPCRTCHLSHGEQIDFCSGCHDNGGQRLVGGVVIPRAENPWADGGEPPAGAP